MCVIAIQKSWAPTPPVRTTQQCRVGALLLSTVAVAATSIPPPLGRHGRGTGGWRRTNETTGHRDTRVRQTAEVQPRWSVWGRKKKKKRPGRTHGHDAICRGDPSSTAVLFLACTRTRGGAAGGHPTSGTHGHGSGTRSGSPSHFTPLCVRPRTPVSRLRQAAACVSQP